MPLTAIRLGFRPQSVYRLKSPTVLHAVKQRLSFTIAVLSLIAFVVGNMVGQHGWYSFWKSVLGKEDDTLIAFVGTVTPIERLPEYSEWAKYGGSKQLHTFRQVPEQVLRDLPSYDQAQLTSGAASSFALQAYSTLWAGGYNSPYGSHPGVDIDAPSGTPVRSIANGVIEKVSMGTSGFGHYIMIRHPNVPDSSVEGGTTTLRSTYAHLDEVLVREGEVVQSIGTVGRTGLVFGATGYHLYFQLEKDSAPYHPYWPFTSDQARSDGLSYVQAVNSTRYQGNLFTYTLNPMAFVQQYVSYAPPPATTLVASVGSTVVSPSAIVPRSLRSAVDARRAQRLSRVTVAATSPVSVATTTVVPASTVVEVSRTISAEAPVPSPIITPSTNVDVDHLTIQHSGVLTRTWQKVTISTVDTEGRLVRSPSFAGRLYVIPDFGEAEIRPSELSPLDFVNGVATVNVLVRSQNKPVFIVTKGAFETRSQPMVPTR
jgi:murein DD-endopeptidase MepM/ murein hydrolase activator NlpD